MKNTSLLIIIITFLAFLNSGIAIASSDCKSLANQIINYGKNSICTVSKGCTIDWKKYTDSEIQMIKEESVSLAEGPVFLKQIIFSKNGFERSVQGFDPENEILDLLEALTIQSMNKKSQGLQLVFITKKVDGKITPVSSSQLITKLDEISPDKVKKLWNEANDKLIDMNGHTGYYTMLFLFADGRIGHPLHSGHKGILDEVYESIIEGEGHNPSIPNKLWGIKLTQNFNSGEDTIFLYDPALNL